MTTSATAIADIGAMITSNPQIKSGVPIIAGTGVTVRRIANWHKLGLTPTEIAARIGHLTEAQVYAALSYYHANQSAIEQDIAEEDGAYEQWQKMARPSSDSIEALFQKLVNEWRKETAHLSLIAKKVMHPAYQRIIGLGPRAIPLILRELEQKPGFWFWALQALTGEDPASPDATVDETAQAWLQWGKEHQYL
jgi:uncharacterized protein (DUF433 family)